MLPHFVSEPWGLSCWELIRWDWYHYFRPSFKNREIWLPMSDSYISVLLASWWIPDIPNIFLTPHFQRNATQDKVVHWGSLELNRNTFIDLTCEPRPFTNYFQFDPSQCPGSSPLFYRSGVGNDHGTTRHCLFELATIGGGRKEGK